MQFPGLQPVGMIIPCRWLSLVDDYPAEDDYPAVAELCSVIPPSSPLLSDHNPTNISNVFYSNPLYFTPICSILLLSTVKLHSTVLYSNPMYNTQSSMLYPDPLYYTPIQYFILIPLYYTPIQCVIIQSTIFLLYCTILHSTALYQNALHTTRVTKVGHYLPDE